MAPPLVTIVVATYNRPTILKCALESVIYQDFKQWQLFVIGDNCDDRTRQIVEELDHPGIHYHNNPYRYGEQSGSNNIGMELSNTPYLALLNHDDIWTPDHLQKAVDHLQQNHDTQFYVANSIFSRRLDENGFPQLKYVQPDRRPSRAFSMSHSYIEPCSAWVFRREVFDRVGHWKHGSETFRPPILDFFLRCWRKRIKFHFAKAITCIGGNFHHLVKSENIYGHDGGETRMLLEHFKKCKKEGIPYLPDSSKLVKGRSRPTLLRGGKLSRRQILNYLLANGLTAKFYYLTGIDLHEKIRYRIAGKNRFKLSKRRTGENKPIIKPSFSKALELATTNLR